MMWIKGFEENVKMSKSEYLYVFNSYSTSKSDEFEQENSMKIRHMRSAKKIWFYA